MEKKFNGVKKFLVFLLVVCSALTALCFTACGEKTVKKVTVGKLPTKTEYYVGEEFDPAGGEIIVTYSDGSTETKAMTDEGVTCEVSLTVEDGEESSDKTVTVRYGEKGVRFEVKVSYSSIDFVFDYGYADKEEIVKIHKDEKATRPADPVREGFTFDNWYADETLTMPYDFENETVAAKTTVYAKWLDNAATYFDVQFDYNYIGSVSPAPQKVKSGDKAVRLVVDPTRDGYRFDGWVTSSSGDKAFAFDTAVTAATTVYAKWVRTSTGKQTFVFEAEDTDLEGKVGKGLSGTAPGKAMVQKTTEHGASNDHFVGYLYELGLSLDFQIVSDMAVEDATIVFRFSAEMRDFDIDPNKIKISVNNDYLQYTKISFTNVPKGSSEDVTKVNALPFKDYTIATNVKLDKGQNYIQFLVDNDEPTEGTTMTGIAPLVDCMKITTEAVLSWDASLGLPKKGNY